MRYLLFNAAGCRVYFLQQSYCGIFMILLRIVAGIICICFISAAAYGETTPVEDTRPFLSRSGTGGICRGISHLAGAPLVVPLSCIYGFVAPFQGDPEQNGTTNMATYAVAQAIASPAYIGINTMAAVVLVSPAVSGACKKPISARSEHLCRPAQ